MTDPGFFTVRTEGGLLPSAFLQGLGQSASGGGDAVPGLTPDAYHLIGHERLNEAANRAWARLLGAWEAYRKKLHRVPEGDPATTATREKWLLPLFQELGYGRLQTTEAEAFTVNGTSYAISHAWGATPIHLLGSRIDLDTRSPGIAGAARSSPHSLVQELLNRSPGHLWAFLSNGRRLRILRDNLSLTRQAFVEFDLESMMEGEIYSDFLLLYLLCHQSRVEADRPEDCWLERWTELARKQGTRALDAMREGVKQAIEALGRGFLSHRSNGALRDSLRGGDLDKQEYYRQLLRWVYRLIFLFAAEDRDLLLVPEAPEEAKDRYREHYSTVRLRRLAAQTKGGPHPDLWRALSLVAGKLSQPQGCPGLALPALGSHLWEPEPTAALNDCELSNRHLLSAVWHLSVLEGKVRQNVDYKNLGPEELGSVYEALLELQPRMNIDAGTFTLEVVAGHERKESGSYYTATSLINALMDSALEPLLDEASSSEDPRKALLELKICDPACGSGHFLIAVAHRIAKRWAVHDTGDEEPGPEAIRYGLREVIAHCIYGVDVNPMALELCKVNLWLEALEPGKPLSFLDHHLKCGNSLIGATPSLLEKGIPNKAFQDLPGDDHDVVLRYRTANRRERRDRESGQIRIDYTGPWSRIGDFARSYAILEAIPDDTLEGTQKQEERYHEIMESTPYQESRLWADAWCAAFVWRKVEELGHPEPMTEEIFRKLERNPNMMSSALREEIQRLSAEYNFFHWHLAFPKVFYLEESGQAVEGREEGWSGGFDLVIGNPPWEKVQTEEVPFFASRAPEIADLTGKRRKKAIDDLEKTDSDLAAEWQQYARHISGLDALFRHSGLYPLSARGKFNSYALFTELKSRLAKDRVGTIVPTGIATEPTAKKLFQHLTRTGKLRSLYDLENRKKLFPDVDSRYRFCLLTLGSPRSAEDPKFQFAFYLQDPTVLQRPESRFELQRSEITAINPNSQTLPIFRNPREAKIAVEIHRRVPVLQAKKPEDPDRWDIALHRMINMTDDSGEFVDYGAHEDRGPKEEPLYRLYEAKMFHQFDHRWASLAEGSSEPNREDPWDVSKPRHLTPVSLVNQKLPDPWHRHWLLAWRDIARATDERTLIATVLPFSGVANTAYLLYPAESAALTAALVASLCAFVVDFTARLKISGMHLTPSGMKEIPCLTPGQLRESVGWSAKKVEAVEWLLPRILELTYTAWDLEPFAQDCGYEGPPFRWDESRRFQLRCELDAAFFHLYGIDRDDVDYVMETFPIVKGKDVKEYGDYRTKLVILDLYDRMQQAIDTGEPYQTVLDPPPADPSLAHPEDTRPGWAEEP